MQNDQTLKLKVKKASEWIARHKSFLFGAGVGVVLFFIFFGQQACDSRRESIENERINALEREKAKERETFQTYLNMANADHATTTTILDAMAGMTRDIDNLKKTDETITRRVKEIETGDYAAARRQKNDQSAIRAGRQPVNKKPIIARETEALRADAELYPEN